MAPVQSLSHTYTPRFPHSPPQVVGFDSSGGKKFKFEGAVTAEALAVFGEDVVAGKAPKFFKSGERAGWVAGWLAGWVGGGGGKGARRGHAGSGAWLGGRGRLRREAGRQRGGWARRVGTAAVWAAARVAGAGRRIREVRFARRLALLFSPPAPALLTSGPSSPRLACPPAAADPAEPLDKGVTIVTGNNVESIVKDPTKDVLLEVYAPWCGHCKVSSGGREKQKRRRGRGRGWRGPRQQKGGGPRRRRLRWCARAPRPCTAPVPPRLPHPHPAPPPSPPRCPPPAPAGTGPRVGEAGQALCQDRLCRDCQDGRHRERAPRHRGAGAAGGGGAGVPHAGVQRGWSWDGLPASQAAWGARERRDPAHACLCPPPAALLTRPPGRRLRPRARRASPPSSSSLPRRAPRLFRTRAAAPWATSPSF